MAWSELSGPLSMAKPIAITTIILPVNLGWCGFPHVDCEFQVGGFTSSDSVLSPGLQIEPGHRSSLLNE